MTQAPRSVTVRALPKFSKGSTIDKAVHPSSPTDRRDMIRQPDCIPAHVTEVPAPTRKDKGPFDIGLHHPRRSSACVGTMQVSGQGPITSLASSHEANLFWSINMLSISKRYPCGSPRQLALFFFSNKKCSDD